MCNFCSSSFWFSSQSHLVSLFLSNSRRILFSSLHSRIIPIFSFSPSLIYSASIAVFMLFSAETIASCSVFFIFLEMSFLSAWISSYLLRFLSRSLLSFFRSPLNLLQFSLPRISFFRSSFLSLVFFSFSLFPSHTSALSLFHLSLSENFWIASSGLLHFSLSPVSSNFNLHSVIPAFSFTFFRIHSLPPIFRFAFSLNPPLSLLSSTVFNFAFPRIVWLNF